MSSPLGEGPSGNMTLPILIIPNNYIRHCTMPGCKNTMPSNQSVVCHAKLTELEQVHEQLLEEECEVAVAEACEREAAVRCECEVTERQRQKVAEK